MARISPPWLAPQPNPENTNFIYNQSRGLYPHNVKLHSTFSDGRAERRRPDWLENSGRATLPPATKNMFTKKMGNPVSLSMNPITNSVPEYMQEMYEKQWLEEEAALNGQGQGQDQGQAQPRLPPPQSQPQAQREPNAQTKTTVTFQPVFRQETVGELRAQDRLSDRPFTSPSPSNAYEARPSSREYVFPDLQPQSDNKAPPRNLVPRKPQEVPLGGTQDRAFYNPAKDQSKPGNYRRVSTISGDLFSAGTGRFQSDNGLANAALYYKTTRPLGARLRSHGVSKTTDAGYHFDCYTPFQA